MLKSNNFVPALSPANHGEIGQNEQGASPKDARLGTTAMKLAMDRAHASHAAALCRTTELYKSVENS